MRTYVASVADALDLAERMKDDEIERKFQRILKKIWACKPSDCTDCQHRLSCSGIGIDR